LKRGVQLLDALVFTLAIRRKSLLNSNLRRNRRRDDLRWHGACLTAGPATRETNQREGRWEEV